MIGLDRLSSSAQSIQYLLCVRSRAALAMVDFNTSIYQRACQWPMPWRCVVTSEGYHGPLLWYLHRGDTWQCWHCSSPAITLHILTLRRCSAQWWNISCDRQSCRDCTLITWPEWIDLLPFYLGCGGLYCWWSNTWTAPDVLHVQPPAGGWCDD